MTEQKPPRKTIEPLKERQLQLVKEFQLINKWEDRYRKIISIGKTLPPLEDQHKTDDLKVKGCQSQVWLMARQDEHQHLHFQADSDALIVKGLVAILLRIYTDATPDEILNTPPDFIKELGFAHHLSPSRTNGLYALIKQIFFYATAFKYQQTM